MTNTLMENIWNCTEVGTPIHHVTITLKAFDKRVLERKVEELGTADYEGYSYNVDDVEYKEVPTTEEDYK